MKDKKNQILTGAFLNRKNANSGKVIGGERNVENIREGRQQKRHRIKKALRGGLREGPKHQLKQLKQPSDHRQSLNPSAEVFVPLRERIFQQDFPALLSSAPRPTRTAGTFPIYAEALRREHQHEHRDGGEQTIETVPSTWTTLSERKGQGNGDGGSIDKVEVKSPLGRVMGDEGGKWEVGGDPHPLLQPNVTVYGSKQATRAHEELWCRVATSYQSKVPSPPQNALNASIQATAQESRWHTWLKPHENHCYEHNSSFTSFTTTFSTSTKSNAIGDKVAISIDETDIMEVISSNDSKKLQSFFSSTPISSIDRKLLPVPGTLTPLSPSLSPLPSLPSPFPSVPTSPRTHLHIYIPTHTIITTLTLTPFPLLTTHEHFLHWVCSQALQK